MQYTIGGLPIIENPEQQFAQEIGKNVVIIDKSKSFSERRKAYCSIMNIRRSFSIAQWSEFMKSFNSFRISKGFRGLSQLLHEISNEILNYRADCSITKNLKSIIYSEREGIMSSNNVNLSSKILEVVARCLITMGNDFLALLGGKVEVVEEKISKKEVTADTHKVEIDGEPDIDYLALCKKIVISLNKEGGQDAVKAALKKAKAKNFRDATAKQLEIAYKYMEKVLSDMEVSAGSTDMDPEKDDDAVEVVEDINYRQECRQMIAEVVKIVGDLSPILPVYKHYGVKGLNSCPEETLPELYQGMKKALAKTQKENPNV